MILSTGPSTIWSQDFGEYEVEKLDREELLDLVLDLFEKIQTFQESSKKERRKQLPLLLSAGTRWTQRWMEGKA